MQNNEYGAFSNNYISDAGETQAEEREKPLEMAPASLEPEKGRYTLSKPQRITIKAVISHDKDVR